MTRVFDIWNEQTHDNCLSVAWIQASWSEDVAVVRRVSSDGKGQKMLNWMSCEDECTLVNFGGVWVSNKQISQDYVGRERANNQEAETNFCESTLLLWTATWDKVKLD